jgi:hypothetical protein
MRRQKQISEKEVKKEREPKRRIFKTYMKHEEHGSCRRQYQLSMFQQILKVVVSNN